MFSRSMKPIHSENQFERSSYWILVFCIWALAFGSYRPSERLMPHDISTVDWIAFVKIVTRVLAFILLGIILIRARPTHNFKKIIYRLLPLALFASWAMSSTLWAPLKALTLAKAFGLVVCVMLSAAIAQVCVDENHLSKILFQLSVMLFLISLANLLGSTFRSVNDVDFRGGLLMSKNDAGQIAGLGIIILLIIALAPQICYNTM
jgi:hypothetical protein